MHQISKSLLILPLGLCCALGLPAFAGSQPNQAGSLQQQAKQQAEALFYPVPQQVNNLGKFHKISALNLPQQAPDSDTLRILAQYPAAASGVKVAMSIVGEKLQGAKKIAGAYNLNFDGKTLTLQGYDATGLFYAAQSALQMLKKNGGMQQCNISDWPDVAFRGTVEGFYGKPWEYADRLSQLEFYGKYKLNSYIYGPKNDPFHGFSKRWREFYPAEKAEEMRKLVQAAHANKVNFIWALHPGQDITWGEPDRQAALKKFQHMYDLGVRSFAIFFDDIGGTGAQAEGQVEFLNFINREFIKKKPDCTPLIMCPTAYWGKGDKYHDILGENMDKDIAMMWTGSSIVDDIKTDAVESINKRIRRPVFVWWNFPVTDYVRHAVFLGRVYGLDEKAMAQLSGFVSNPMDKPEASKIALFGVADICWNTKAFDSGKSWQEGIRSLFPECHEAMQVLANHNSDGGKSFHNYRREESQHVAVQCDKLKALLDSGKSLHGVAEAEQIRAEFLSFVDAASQIRAKCNNKRLLAELDPWLTDFANLGKAGALAMQAAMAKNTEKPSDSQLKALLQAAAIYAQMQRYSDEISALINKRSGDHWQKSVKTATLRMRPLLESVLEKNSAAAISAISGKAIKQQRPYNSADYKEGVERMLDEDSKSFFYCKQVQKQGDFFGVDLGVLQPLESVEILMGRGDKDHEIIHKGQLEYSADGQLWHKLLPEETSGAKISWKADSPTKGRFVRYRATVTGIPGGKPDVWTAIRDFKVNGGAPVALLTNVASLGKMQLDENSASIGLGALLEVHKLGAGEYVGIEIPSAARAAKLEFDFKTADNAWAELEITRDGKQWTSLPFASNSGRVESKLEGQLKGVRVRNKSAAAVDVNPALFKLHLAGKDAASAALFDAALATAVNVDASEKPFVVALEDPARELWVISDAQPAELQAQTADGKWQKLGSISGLKSRFDLPQGSRAVSFTTKPGKAIQLIELVSK